MRRWRHAVRSRLLLARAFDLLGLDLPVPELLGAGERDALPGAVRVARHADALTRVLLALRGDLRRGVDARNEHRGAGRRLRAGERGGRYDDSGEQSGRRKLEDHD